MAPTSSISTTTATTATALKGDNILTAAYAGIDLPFGRWNVYAGVRFEYSRMALTSYTKIKDWDSETRNYTHADPFLRSM